MRTALILFAVLFFVGLVVGQGVLEGLGNTKGSRELDVLFYVPVLMILLAVFITVRRWINAASRKRQDAAEGVVAAWGNARITQTELIDGYQSTAARYPLAGLVAGLSTDGSTKTNVVFSPDGQLFAKGTRTNFRLHLTIQGPRNHQVYTAKNPGVRSVLRAKKFSDRLNAMSRQQQA